MSGRATFVPGVGLVTVVPGRYEKRLYSLDGPEDLRYVTEMAPEAPDSRADTPVPSRNVWTDRGLLAVIAVGAGALIADGAALWFLAWLIR